MTDGASKRRAQSATRDGHMGADFDGLTDVLGYLPFADMHFERQSFPSAIARSFSDDLHPFRYPHGLEPYGKRVGNTV